MAAPKIFKQIIFILVLATVTGLAVNFSLVQRFFQGEFKQAFFSSQEFPTITFISLQEAEDLFNSQQAVFVDSRPEEDYKKGHILGALNIPFENPKREEILDGLNLSLEKTLVVYCDGRQCGSSLDLAKVLTAHGFQSIKVLFGGWLEWTEAGLPVVEGNAKK